MKCVLVLMVTAVTVSNAVPFNPFYNFKDGNRRHHGGSSSGYSKYFMENPEEMNRPLAYRYMSHPMAAVEMPTSREDSHYSPVHMSYSSNKHNNNKQNYHGTSLWQKMVGEHYFKHPGSYEDHQNSGSDDSGLEEVPYTVVKDYGPYESREYPEAKFACVKSEVDNGEDPMAGLGEMNPLELMGSKRWRKTPSSYMFRELFKYISGVNKEGKEVEMTRPVSTHHQVVQQRFGGDLEVQEMCFYVPAEHQAYPPEPLDSSPVYIHTRPRMRVFARRFGGYLMAAEQWSEQRELLEALLIGKPYHQTEYFTNGFDSPMNFFNRRNEVWIEDTDFVNDDEEHHIVDVGDHQKSGEEDGEEHHEEHEDSEEEAKAEPAPES